MKIQLPSKFVIVCFLGLLSLHGCASSGEDEQLQEESLEDEDGEQEVDQDQEELGEQEAEGDNLIGENTEQDNFNSQVPDPMAGVDGEAPLNDAGLGNPVLDEGSDGTNPDQQMAELNNMINNMNAATEGDPTASDNGAMAPENPSMVADSTSTAATPSNFAAPAPGTARVYFVTTDGAELKDAPGGGTIKSLSQGDPCLGTVEGEWTNIIGQGYIKTSQLSESPVGRSQAQLGWN